MEIEINNKKPIPKLHAATTSAKTLLYRNVSSETDGEIFPQRNQHAYKKYAQ